jgi:tyrosinase
MTTFLTRTHWLSIARIGTPTFCRGVRSAPLFRPFFFLFEMLTYAVDRWFTYLFDTSLRETCGYSGPTPYWDWSRDHADLSHSPIFEDSPEHGLGGTGDCSSSPQADCIVTTGAFSSHNGNFELAWPIPHKLRRNLTLITGWFAHERPANRTLGPESVRNSTEQTTGDFFRFQYAMTGMHNHVHNFVGGDLAGDCPKSLQEKDCQGMASTFTPNDPLFWLHHAQLDRLWSEVLSHHSAPCRISLTSIA